MKYLITVAAIFSLFMSYGQVPQKMSYQTIVRNAQNQLIPNNAVGMRLSIIEGSPTGAVIYVETHTPITNGNGTATIEVGAGTVVSGVFNTIDWSTGNYWLQTEIDPQGGQGYSITGVSQLLTVPFAFFCDQALNAGNGIDTVQVINDSLYVTTASGITMNAGAVNGGSMSESDPIFSASVASAITTLDTTNWNSDIDPNNELQAISISNDTLYLSNGGQIYLGAYGIDLVDDADADPTNELQSWSTLPGIPIEISDGDDVNDADADPTNELQTLSISNDTIYLSNGGFAVLPPGFGGKTHVILTGDITNVQAATLLQNSVGTNTQFISIQNTTNLTTVDLSSVSELVELRVNNNTALSSINISNLQAVYDNITITNNSALSGISFASVTTYPTTIDISYNNSISTLSFPNLTTTIGSMRITFNDLLTSIDLSSLTTTRDLFEISANLSLNTLLTPNLTNIYSTGFGTGIYIQYNQLTNIDLSSVNDITAVDCKFNFNQIPSSNVNLILDRFVNSATPINNGALLYVEGQSPPAPPTGQGITDASTLTLMGVTVTTD